jgi:hypothetical protein
MKGVYRVVLAVSFWLAVSASAQQTGLAGRVSDPGGMAVSGAAVTVTQVGGAAFHTKANGDGTWLVPTLTAGDYVVSVAAPGFTTVETKVSMLVGQTPEVDTALPVASAAQSVVVTSDETAVDTTSSTVAGNITPEEVKNLPINGRNYMELATLVPGVRVNAITNDTPLGNANSGKFQINLDGLQVTQDTADPSFGQPRFSPDAISQFQIITNRFDATLGRSGGIYVNVQSKTGSDQIHGTLFGYFRNDALNAGDPIVKAANAKNAAAIAADTTVYQNPVTPLSDQQFGGTFGGPIKKSKLWYFGSYEGEHQGSGVVSTSPLLGANAVTYPQTINVNEYLGRGDWQPSEKDHVFLRGNGFTFKNDNVVATGATDPSAFYIATRMNYAVLGDWDRQISSHVVNDVHIGFNHFEWQNLPEYESQAISFGSTTVGGAYNYPQIFYQNVQQYRDDLYYLVGKHSFKVGGEFLHTAHTGYFQQNVRGTISGCQAISSARVASELFPKGTTDISTWNYTSSNNPDNVDIDSLCSTATLTQGFGNFNVNIPRNQIGLWAQDDWKVLTRLTLNLGVRYDNDLGAFDPGLKLNNGLLTPESNDNNNFAPRLGFVYDLRGDGKTVIRGGAGLFYADIAANQTIDMQIFNGVTSQQDSVTGTVSNPLNPQNPFPPSVTTPRQAVQPLAPNVETPYTLQISGGIQRQLLFNTVVTADYVHTRIYHDWVRLNSNLIQDPADPQYNLSASTKYAAGTAVMCPDGGVTVDGSRTPGVSYNVCANAFTNINQFFTPNQSGAIYDALQLGVRESLWHGFTSGVAYTYSRLKDSSESPFYYPNKPFVTGVQDEWGPAQDDQRSTLTVNADYAWRYGLSLSGLFHYGSGNAFPTYLSTTQPASYTPSYNRTFSSTPVQYQGSDGAQTCAKATGSPCTFFYNHPANNYLDSSGYYLTKRDALHGQDVYRMDTRLQERRKFGDRISAVIAVEAFNLLNHSNYGTYDGRVNVNTYGQPQATVSAATGIPVEWRPRSLQFLGRLEF